MPMGESDSLCLLFLAQFFLLLVIVRGFPIEGSSFCSTSWTKKNPSKTTPSHPLALAPIVERTTWTRTRSPRAEASQPARPSPYRDREPPLDPDPTYTPPSRGTTPPPPSSFASPLATLQRFLPYYGCHLFFWSLPWMDGRIFLTFCFPSPLPAQHARNQTNLGVCLSGCR
ncbi:hypothetical protein B0T16DRAFT_248095 [Cercophora newfieldiana]|uniref:Uncharacterized protein n=1 Tax=Cercophora newfieldiana TaxID=92897 RepID=A0AA40CIL9_9PEZI|nr:hypothetical protein B0T16DRAFT_248095 [Cercophora newfieldiana]